MNIPEQLRESVLKYRLDELDSVEREKIDALLISDPEFHSAFREAEYDLLDAYASNEITGPQRERVERALQPHTHPSLGLSSAVRAKAAPAKAASKLFTMRAVLWAVAAVLIAGVALGLLSHSHRQSQQLAQSASVPAAAPSVGAETPSEAIPTPPPSNSVQQTSVSLPAVLLLTDGTRSQTTATVRLSPTTKVLLVQWVPSVSLPAGSHYQLKVVSDLGASECQSRGVNRKSGGSDPVVEFSCPAADILAGASFFRVQDALADSDALPLLETAVSVQK